MGPGGKALYLALNRGPTWSRVWCDGCHMKQQTAYIILEHERKFKHLIIM